MAILYPIFGEMQHLWHLLRVGFSHCKVSTAELLLRGKNSRPPSLDIAQEVRAYFTTIAQNTSDPGPIAVRTVHSK